MLKITIPAAEQWDERIGEFVNTPTYKLQLEHSLVSLSKWESKWKKPFTTKTPKTTEELVDYVKCMTITQNVPAEAYTALTSENFAQIRDYMDDAMTATTISKRKRGGKQETITSELIYFWMISYNIPLECQKWHLNRLLTLIQVCDVKNSKPEKRSSNEILRSNAALNAARRKKLGSKG